MAAQDIEKFLPNLVDCIVNADATIKNGLTAISKSGALLAAVVDSEGVLLGIFNDGDARRAILGGASISEPIAPYIKSNPIVGRWDAEPHELRSLALAEGIREIPLVDELGVLKDVFVIVVHEERASLRAYQKTIRKSLTLSNPMVLIAGGKGTRLKSVVNDRPKPLAIVGDKPIMQTIIENAASAGIKNFYISVNYRAEQIVEHLKAEVYSGLNIICIHETEFLGTAGSLGLLGNRWQESLIVSNADVLTNIPVDRVLEFHNSSNATATCVVRPYQVQIPFGVIKIGPKGITGIQEKPTHKHVVSTGIYVLSPKVKDFIKVGKRLDMPGLLQKLIDAGENVAPFLMHEYWRDVGRPEEYALANEEYHDIFGNGH